MSSTGYCTNVAQVSSAGFTYVCQNPDAVWNSDVGRCVTAAKSASVQVCPEKVVNSESGATYNLKIEDTTMGWDLTTGVLTQTDCTYEVPQVETLFFCLPGFEMSTSQDGDHHPSNATAGSSLRKDMLSGINDGDPFRVNIVTKGQNDTASDESGYPSNANNPSRYQNLELASRVATVYMPHCYEDGGDIKCGRDDGGIIEQCTDGDTCIAHKKIWEMPNFINSFSHSDRNTNSSNGFNNRQLLKIGWIEDDFDSGINTSQYTYWKDDETGLHTGANYTFLYYADDDKFDNVEHVPTLFSELNTLVPGGDVDGTESRGARAGWPTTEDDIQDTVSGGGMNLFNSSSETKYDFTYNPNSHNPTHANKIIARFNATKPWYSQDTWNSGASAHYKDDWFTDISGECVGEVCTGDDHNGALFCVDDGSCDKKLGGGINQKLHKCSDKWYYQYEACT